MATGEPLAGPLTLIRHKISPVFIFAQVRTFALLITRKRSPEMTGLPVPGPSLLSCHTCVWECPPGRDFRAVSPLEGTRSISPAGVEEGIVEAPS